MAIQSLYGLHNRIRSRLPQRFMRILRSVPPITATASGVLVLLLLLSTLLPEKLDGPLWDSGQTETIEPDIPDYGDVVANDKHTSDSVSTRKAVSQPPPVTSPATEKSFSRHTEDQAKTTASTTLRKEPDRSAAAKYSIPPPPSGEGGLSPTSRAVAAKPSTPPIPSVPRRKNEAWLLEQSPEAYSIQILAAGSEVAIRKFLRQHKLDKDVYYFESRRNGLPWFPVLYGIYKDRKAAVVALNQLPETLRKAGAWPRPLSAVQKEIKQKR